MYILHTHTTGSSVNTPGNTKIDVNICVNVAFEVKQCINMSKEVNSKYILNNLVSGSCIIAINFITVTNKNRLTMVMVRSIYIYCGYKRRLTMLSL